MQRVGFLFHVFYSFNRSEWLIFTTSNGFFFFLETRISLTHGKKYVKITLQHTKTRGLKTVHICAISFLRSMVVRAWEINGVDFTHKQPENLSGLSIDFAD